MTVCILYLVFLLFSLCFSGANNNNNNNNNKKTVRLCCCRVYIDYSGEFTVGNETYSVEPVDELLRGRHRVYRESDSKRPTHVCGM